MVSETLARIAEIEAVLIAGGVLRFTWYICQRELIDKDGVVKRVDSRSYSALVTGRRRLKYVRTERGSVENKDLVIEWRAK